MDSGAARAGLVSLVGAGPGDPGLITVRGRQRLQDADVVVYDRLAGEAMLRQACPDAELIYVGKQPGKQALTQDGINALLVDRALKGRSVCRLKGGDPFVFGRGGEEALACVEAGVPFEIVPGVTSAIAAPAYAGIPVTHRQVAASFAVITGHEDPARTSSAVHWDRLAQAVDTLVLLMGVENLAEITAKLIQHGRSPSTPAALVQWGTTPRQRTLLTTLGELVEQSRAFGSPAVTIIGDVVSLAPRLGWFDRRPLFGRRVLVTRSREQASDLSARLINLGADVLEFPTIRVQPYSLAEVPDLAEQLRAAPSWIVFTSINAVSCFVSLLRESGGDVRSIGTAKIAAVGPVTWAAVESAGLRVNYIPSESLAAKIVDDFPEPLDGERVLIPRARVAPEDLPQSLRAKGAEVDVLPVYETVSDEPPDEIREAVRDGEVDIITFTSSSTVRNFLNILPAADVPASIAIACIGPVTAETARAAGLRVDTIATDHTVSGLVAAVLEMEDRGRRTEDEGRRTD